MATPTSSCGSIGYNTEVMDIPMLLDIINVWNIKKVPVKEINQIYVYFIDVLSKKQYIF